MKTKVESDVLSGLCSIEADARLAALRSLKNTVIGDKRKKASFVKLGAVQLLVEILTSDTEPSLLIQAAAAVRFHPWSPVCTSAPRRQGLVVATEPLGKPHLGPEASA